MEVPSSEFIAHSGHNPPPQNLTVSYVDLTNSNLSSTYPTPHYVLVIDNAFTRMECEEILLIGESTQPEWEPALLDHGSGRQELAPDYRNCERIMRDDRDLAARLLERVRPYIKDIEIIGGGGKHTDVKWPSIVGGAKGRKWGMTRLNERLRFLKYGPGQFFDGHCDGQYSTHSRAHELTAKERLELPPEERSFVTFHLYLSDVEERAGGATQILSWNLKTSLGIEAKQGRVLLFQQRGVIHCGQEVTKGVKHTLRTDVMYRAIVEPKEN